MRTLSIPFNSITRPPASRHPLGLVEKLARTRLAGGDPRLSEGPKRSRKPPEQSSLPGDRSRVLGSLQPLGHPADADQRLGDHRLSPGLGLAAVAHRLAVEAVGALEGVEGALRVPALQPHEPEVEQRPVP